MSKVPSHESMRHYCDGVIKHLRTASGKGFGKLVMELTRIRKEWG